MKTKQKILSLILTIICVCLLCNTQYNGVLAEEYDNSTSAKGMCVIEAKSGRIIYEKNKDLKLPMASTTKIITAITAIENLKDDLDVKYTVPEKAVGIEGTSMYLKHGEQLTKRELLYGLMLPSGNDAATALALLTCDTEEEFCELMQQTALKAGAKNSSFANAHGLDNDNHYTTAYDLAMITAYALNNPIFLEISTTKNITIEPTEQYGARYLKNKNKLLSSLPNCIGVKTGFTDNAGRCFVSAVDGDNERFVCVVLNCQPMFEDSARLLTNALSEYKMYDLMLANKYITTLPVEEGDKNYARLYVSEGFSYPLTESEYNSLEINYNLPKILIAPIDCEKNIGTVEIFIDNHLIFSSKICSIDKVNTIDNYDKITDILDKWM